MHWWNIVIAKELIRRLGCVESHPDLPMEKAVAPEIGQHNR
jgi:hypothetical protein